MSFTFLPKTRLGKVSVGAFATFVVTWTLDIVLMPKLGSDLMTGAGEPALSDILLGLLTIAGIIAIFVGLVTGMIALFRKKDHSVLLIIVTLLCFFISGIAVLFLSEGFIL
ncbi:hypothetical protein [uncultured Trichococcus sp.]|uniref:hypothetical protein n=1 Tax=uncultured Trichococcus sp. TaxID=189665 RepID=UPI002A189031|nr:hypothetical protein [uncultured Trichococcus sp.]